MGPFTLVLPKIAEPVCAAFRMLRKSRYILGVETDPVFTRHPRVLRKEATSSSEAVSGRDNPSTSRGALSIEGPAIDHRGR